MIGRRRHYAQAFDDAWSGGTPGDERVAELVRFAESLCEAAVVEPTPAFRSSLRHQLMTEAATVLVPQPATAGITSATRTRPVRRRLAGLTAAIVASAGAVGIVASSASAMPGELLYPVKRGVESVELTLHRDDASRGSFQLAQASERLAEARELTASGRSAHLIDDTLDDFSDQAAAGSGHLFSDFSTHGEEKSIRKVNDFAASASVDLADLAPRLPAASGESLAAATAAISALATEATSLCSSCTTTDVESLVNSVTDLAQSIPTAKPPATEEDTDAADSGAPAADKPGKAADSGDSGSTAGSTPSRAPGSDPTTPAPKPTSAPAPTPTPTPTAQTPSLTDLTDPLIGGLLGDDDQEGLVPGLLNGLLPPST